MGPGQTTRNPHTIMLPPPNLTVGTMQSLKKRSSGIRQTQTRSSDCKVRFITPKNSFPQSNDSELYTIAIDASHSVE
ncbi:hypothetical protein TNCV_1737291 [Trichonephila clavipes]|nr:hypothetical protein TNCV_1737291 [Trichonephila clavipes]